MCLQVLQWPSPIGLYGIFGLIDLYGLFGLIVLFSLIGLFGPIDLQNEVATISGAAINK